MASLGTFSAALRELDPDAERDTFHFYDEPFTVFGVIPGIVELTISAALAGKVSGVDGDAAMFEAMRHALTIPATGDGDRPDESQWDRFYRLAADKKAPGELLTAITLNILGAQVGKATALPSTSSPGQPETSTSSSTSASDSPDSHPLRPVDEVLAG